MGKFNPFSSNWLNRLKWMIVETVNKTLNTDLAWSSLSSAENTFLFIFGAVKNK